MAPSEVETAILTLWDAVNRIENEYVDEKELHSLSVELQYLNDTEFEPCFFVPRPNQFLDEHPIDWEQMGDEAEELKEQLLFEDLDPAARNDPDKSVGCNPLDGAREISEYFRTQMYHAPRVGAPDWEAMSFSRWNRINWGDFLWDKLLGLAAGFQDARPHGGLIWLLNFREILHPSQRRCTLLISS